jgi:hypothetical protein
LGGADNVGAEVVSLTHSGKMFDKGRIDLIYLRIGIPWLVKVIIPNKFLEGEVSIKSHVGRRKLFPINGLNQHDQHVQYRLNGSLYAGLGD